MPTKKEFDTGVKIGKVISSLEEISRDLDTKGYVGIANQIEDAVAELVEIVVDINA